MRLRPIRVTLRAYGNSVGFVIPKPLAESLGLEAGQEWRIYLGRGAGLKATARTLGGRESLGFTVPADERRKRNWMVGDAVEVPIAKWRREANKRGVEGDAP